MTTQQEKVLKPKLDLLELARQLGNVSQACRIMGYSRDTRYRYKELYGRGLRWPVVEALVAGNPDVVVTIENVPAPG